ncbi:hypothetical protein COEREDRAFT_91140 [Coemansia reversa NRRL 1564]|uniref:Uncharacterized protein n=1 Tax=Coemansia reversa (strain ATCC 12441 / NRRL 1564) TaxID=763665 RepID=A0A2G5BIB3_COERN|nr:hypothetical protein COEREDRAFT_91140 [Coemansia reversa NRRL 1564]|eukprot:PIA18764.1 hypothetical protein COEREDRAFT_91140 [Coemansia reversa NRRL 1564]
MQTALAFALLAFLIEMVMLAWETSWDPQRREARTAAAWISRARMATVFYFAARTSEPTLQ